jgi:hypothetical protein
MAARTRSTVTPKYKTQYRVRNWTAYEELLRRRGDITLWFDEDAVDAWNAAPSVHVTATAATSSPAKTSTGTRRLTSGAPSS